MLLRADTVLTMTGSPLSGVDVRVDGNRITEIGPGLTPLPDEELRMLPGQVLLPGLINAHCHLDYTAFKGAIFPGRNFAGWIKRINALKGNFSPDDFLKSIENGIRYKKEAREQKRRLRK